MSSIRTKSIPSLFNIESIMLQSQSEKVPFNKVQGVASTNVHAYSNGDDDFFSVE